MGPPAATLNIRSTLGEESGPSFSSSFNMLFRSLHVPAPSHRPRQEDPLPPDTSSPLMTARKPIPDAASMSRALDGARRAGCWCGKGHSCSVFGQPFRALLVHGIDGHRRHRALRLTVSRRRCRMPKFQGLASSYCMTDGLTCFDGSVGALPPPPSCTQLRQALHEQRTSRP